MLYLTHGGFVYSVVPFVLNITRSGVGSHYGTLSGPIGAFSAATKPRDKFGKSGKNFLTNPGKIGTGYGYVCVLKNCMWQK